MTPMCPHEVDVAAVAASGRWPQAASAELRGHVAGCERCREMAELVALAATDPVVGADAAPLPAAAEVWWRLAVRARLEREHAAARPVVWLQGVAAACGVGLAVAAAGRGWPAAEQGLMAALDWLERLAPEVPRAVQPSADPLMMLVFAAGGALGLATFVAAAVVWLADD